MRWRVALLPMATAVLAFALAGATPARVAGDGDLVVYPLAGGPASMIDVAWLPDGEVIVLADRPTLSRTDLSGRTLALPVEATTQPDGHNGLAVAPDGAVLFSERGRVVRRAADGTVTVIAGRVEPAEASGDGGPAVGAGMTPAGIALQADGALLIADMDSHRVRRVDRAGRIATVAGTGRAGSSGDGGPATGARLTSPFAVSALPDGSYLIAEGETQVRIRRVGADGRISPAVGGRRARTGRCPGGPVPAPSFRLGSFYTFGDLTALPSGGFLVSSERGIFRISAAGLLAPVACGPPYPAPAEWIYVHGRRAGDALIDASAAPMAVGEDGSVLVGFDVLAAVGARRLGVALAPETLGAVHRGRIVLQSTDAATVELRVLRGRRIVQTLSADVGPGRTELRLPRRLGAGIHAMRLSAKDARGRAATHRMRVLGRPRLSRRLARRFIRTGFDDLYEGEGEYHLRFARCRHRGARVVRCKVTDSPSPGRPVREWWTASITLRGDGVLVYRIRFLPTRWRQSSAVWFR